MSVYDNHTIRFFLGAFLGFTLLSTFAESQPELDLSKLKQTLGKRDEYQSVITRVVQKKVLPSLTEPVENAGKLWLVPQKSFRWEQGTPVVNTALFSDEHVYLINEVEMTVEKYDSDDRSVRPLMLLLGMGKDSSFEGLLDNFKPISVEETAKMLSVSFLPDSGLMKRAVRQLTLIIDLKSSFPSYIIWEQNDGAVITTEFQSPKFDVPVIPETFLFKKELYTLKD